MHLNPEQGREKSMHLKGNDMYVLKTCAVIGKLVFAIVFVYCCIQPSGGFVIIIIIIFKNILLN